MNQAHIYHEVSKTDFATMTSDAFHFYSSNPECSIVIRCEDPRIDNNPTYLSLFDDSKSIEHGNLIFADITNRGKMFKQSTLKDAISYIVKNQKLDDPFYLSIVFYSRDDDLIHFLAY